MRFADGESGRGRSRKRPVLLVLAAVAAIGAALLVYLVLQERAEGQAEIEEQNRLLRSAQDECSGSGKLIGKLGDGGYTLIVDTEGDDDVEGDTYEGLMCVLDHLDMPSSVRNDLGETRAMDGRQEASWDRITAAWRYHPDTGINISLTLEPARG